MKRTANDEPVVDDLVLGASGRLAARECHDTADVPGLVSKVELILSGVIPHLARLALAGSSASVQATLHYSAFSIAMPANGNLRFRVRLPWVCRPADLCSAATAGGLQTCCCLRTTARLQPCAVVYVTPPPVKHYPRPVRHYRPCRCYGS
jgi:hypothetical protein